MKKSPSPYITFCVMHVKRLDCTRRCIKAIFETTTVPFEILLLVQGRQTEEAYEYFRSIEETKHVTIIFSGKNIGAPPGRALLVKKADSPLIMTIDNDTYLQEGWLEPILLLFRDPQIVCASMPLYDKDGTLVNPGGAIISTVNGVFKDTPIEIPEHPSPDCPISYAKVDSVCEGTHSICMFPGNRIISYAKVDSVCEGCMIFKHEVKEFVQWDPNYKINYGGYDMSLTFKKLAEAHDAISVVSLFSRAEHWQEPNSSYKGIRMDYPQIAKSYARFRKKWGLRIPGRKHYVVKYVFPLLRSPIAWFLRWLRRRPPLVWIWKPKVM